jgi:hypothetical protein
MTGVALVQPVLEEVAALAKQSMVEPSQVGSALSTRLDAICKEVTRFSLYKIRLPDSDCVAIYIA